MINMMYIIQINVASNVGLVDLLYRECATSKLTEVISSINAQVSFANVRRMHQGCESSQSFIPSALKTQHLSLVPFPQKNNYFHSIHIPGV